MDITVKLIRTKLIASTECSHLYSTRDICIEINANYFVVTLEDYMLALLNILDALFISYITINYCAAQHANPVKPPCYCQRYACYFDDKCFCCQGLKAPGPGRLCYKSEYQCNRNCSCRAPESAPAPALAITNNKSF